MINRMSFRRVVWHCRSCCSYIKDDLPVVRYCFFRPHLISGWTMKTLWSNAPIPVGICCWKSFSTSVSSIKSSSSSSSSSASSSGLVVLLFHFQILKEKVLLGEHSCSEFILPCISLGICLGRPGLIWVNVKKWIRLFQDEQGLHETLVNKYLPIMQHAGLMIHLHVY